MGLADKESVTGISDIMNKIGAKAEDRKVVIPAREAAKEAEKKAKAMMVFFVVLPLNYTMVPSLQAKIQHLCMLHQVWF